MRTALPLLSCSLLLLLSACSSSDSNNSSNSSATTGTTTQDESCPVVVKDADCDKTQRPFVFVHGTYGSGENFAHVAQLLESNGFCSDRIVGVEYDSLGDSPGNVCTDAGAKPGCGKIDDVINKVLADNPDFTQVDLAGHSQGTAHCGAYLSVPSQAAKVAHYINFSGVPDVGDVQTLSLSSQHDLGGSPHHATGKNVKTVTFTDQDHFAVAASTGSFVEVFKYLTGKAPTYTSVQCGEDPLFVEGIAETFADNTPVTGKIEVREVGTSPRGTEAPAISAVGDATGHFGPLQLKRNVAYEFKGFDSKGGVVGYQYFTPFKRTNRLIRLLTPSGITAVSSLTTDKFVKAPDQVGLVLQWAGGAFRQDLGARLTINGTEVLESDNAGEKAFSNGSLNGGVVAIFGSDYNKNAKTDLGLFDAAPFIALSDIYEQATTPAFIDFSFIAGTEDPNVVNETARVSNWPSDAGLVSLMFQ